MKKQFRKNGALALAMLLFGQAMVLMPLSIYSVEPGEPIEGPGEGPDQPVEPKKPVGPPVVDPAQREQAVRAIEAGDVGALNATDPEVVKQAVAQDPTVVSKLTPKKLVQLKPEVVSAITGGFREKIDSIKKQPEQTRVPAYAETVRSAIDLGKFLIEVPVEAINDALAALVAVVYMITRWAPLVPGLGESLGKDFITTSVGLEDKFNSLFEIKDARETAKKEKMIKDLTEQMFQIAADAKRNADGDVQSAALATVGEIVEKAPPAVRLYLLTEGEWGELIREAEEGVNTGRKGALEARADLSTALFKEILERTAAKMDVSSRLRKQAELIQGKVMASLREPQRKTPEEQMIEALAVFDPASASDEIIDTLKRTKAYREGDETKVKELSAVLDKLLVKGLTPETGKELLEVGDILVRYTEGLEDEERSAMMKTIPSGTSQPIDPIIEMQLRITNLANRRIKSALQELKVQQFAGRR